MMTNGRKEGVEVVRNPTTWHKCHQCMHNPQEALDRSSCKKLSKRKTLPQILHSRSRIRRETKRAKEEEEREERATYPLLSYSLTSSVLFPSSLSLSSSFVGWLGYPCRPGSSLDTNPVFRTGSIPDPETPSFETIISFISLLLTLSKEPNCT